MGRKSVIVHSVSRKTLFPLMGSLIASDLTAKQGALLVLKAGVIEIGTADVDTVNFLGICPQELENGILKGPHRTDVDDSIASPELEGPIYGVTALMVLEVGDTFAPGDKVYQELGDATGRTVTKDQPAGGEAVGIFAGQESITAVAGDEGEILIGSRHPNDTLNF